MKSILKMMFGLLMVLAIVPVASAAEEKVVYHFGEHEQAAHGLYNIRNHLAVSPNAKIVVVANSSGVGIFVDGAKDKNGNPYEILVQELSAKKVEFRVCNNSLVGMKIDKSRLLPEVTVVPAGVAEISRLQFQEGYGYIKP